MEPFKEGSQAYQITGMSALFIPYPSFPPSFLSSIPYPFSLLPSILPLFYHLALILYWDI